MIILTEYFSLSFEKHCNKAFPDFLISKGLIPRGLPRFVIPAKAGIQKIKLDAGSSPA
jgi:hypothetical protein